MFPKEYGSASICHRFQKWVGKRVFEKLWIRLLKISDYIRGIEWEWQSLDSVSKAPLGDLTGPNPTADRGKPGTKRHVLAYKKGIPLSVVITAANTHDMKAATETLDYIVTKRPHPKKKKQQ